MIFKIDNSTSKIQLETPKSTIIIVYRDGKISISIKPAISLKINKTQTQTEIVYGE